MERLEVLKTYKIFIDGKFPRTESGRFSQLKNKRGEVIANVCLSSRKDLKAAVVAARNVFPGWSGRSAYNRGQILYRMAEMLEGRAEQFVAELVKQGIPIKKAENEIGMSVDRLVYYAGWCDKFQTLFSSVNPVATMHHNFSVPEPTGVVCMLAPKASALLGLVSMIAPAIAGGNTCVVLASETYPLTAITFAEVLATSDLPGGVVNILTGTEEELAPHFSSHMDVNAFVCYESDNKKLKLYTENCSLNVKRFFNWNKNWEEAESENPYFILDLQEIKTTWHPVENLGTSGTKY